MGQVTVTQIAQYAAVGGQPGNIKVVWNNPVPGAVYAFSLDIQGALIGPGEKYLELSPLRYYSLSDDIASGRAIRFTVTSLRDSAVYFHINMSVAHP